jgi:hypothetical protein
MATPVTAAGGLLAAAELPPPHAVNSNAARAVRKARVMVFTKKPPDARQSAHRQAADQIGEAAQSERTCDVAGATDYAVIAGGKRNLGKLRDGFDKTSCCYSAIQSCAVLRLVSATSVLDIQ